MSGRPDFRAGSIVGNSSSSLRPGQCCNGAARPTPARSAPKSGTKSPFQFRLYHGLTPETDTTCFYFWATANGYRQDDPRATEALFGEIAAAFQEDKSIVEQQQLRMTELGEDALVDITTDAARMHMRRTVARMLDEEAAALAAE